MRKQLLTTTAILTACLASAQATNYPTGSTVANFTVTDVLGQTHDLYAYHAQGKYVLLDFFFYDCGPCQANAPAYGEFYETYGCNSADVICLSVNWGEDTDAQVAAFAEDFGGDHQHPPAVGSGGSNEVDAAFGISAYPTFCLVGPDHVMVSNDIWPLTNGAASLAAAFPVGSLQEANCVVGLRENATATSVEVYPVPTSGIVNLEISGIPSTPVTAIVVDALGRSVMTFGFGTSNGSLRRSIDLGTLADGQYALQVHSGVAQPIVRRIVIAR